MQKLNSKDAEMSLIGCLILSKKARVNLANKLSKDIFYHSLNQQIYKAIYKLEKDSNMEVDLATVVEELRRQEVDIPTSYVTECTDKVVAASNAESYYNQLYELYYRRQLAKTSEQNKSLAYDFDKDIDEISSKAESSIYDLTLDTKTDKSYNRISDTLLNHLDYIEDIDPSEDIVGIETPFTKLNRWTGGLKPGETTVLAARPKQGKSTLASNIAQFAAVKRGIPVGFYSLEMSERKAVIRMLANEASINSHKLRNGTCSEEEWQRISTLADNLYNAPININDTPGLSIQEIRSDARRMKMEEGVQLIVIDYAEKVQYHGRYERKAEKIFKIAEEVSQMNKELDVHTILISQVNRNCEYRDDKRPKMADLKASSGLEQEANMIAFLYRESYYNQQVPDRFKDTTEFIVRANRDGEPKRCLLQFRRKYNRFQDCPAELAKNYYQWIQGEGG